MVKICWKHKKFVDNDFFSTIFYEPKFVGKSTVDNICQ